MTAADWSEAAARYSHGGVIPHAARGVLALLAADPFFDRKAAAEERHLIARYRQIGISVESADVRKRLGRCRLDERRVP